MSSKVDYEIDYSMPVTQTIDLTVTKFNQDLWNRLITLNSLPVTLEPSFVVLPTNPLPAELPMTEQEWLVCEDHAKMVFQYHELGNPSERAIVRNTYASSKYPEGVQLPYHKLEQFMEAAGCSACRSLAKGRGMDFWVDSVSNCVSCKPRAVKANLLRCIMGNPWRPLRLKEEKQEDCPTCRGKGDVRKSEIYAKRWDRESCGACDGTGKLTVVAPYPLWFTPAICQIARNIHDRQTFEELPILADALEEAGCFDPPGRTVTDVLRERNTVIGCCSQHADNMACDCLDNAVPEGILAHLRGPGPHARGCHVLDLLLENE